MKCRDFYCFQLYTLPNDKILDWLKIKPYKKHFFFFFFLWCSLNPFPNDKFKTRPNSKTLQTTILNLTKMAESSSNG